MTQFFSENELVAMLHIPIDSIIASPREWRNQQQLPSPTVDDWNFIRNLVNSPSHTQNGIPDLRTVEVIESQCSSLSFYPYLEERMLHEVSCYLDNGISTVMLENIAPPYFSRDTIPGVVTGVMGCLAATIRKLFPDFKIGIQILAFGDDSAMQIAVRHGLDFVRTESALFEGIRPEGRTPNGGNLAYLYMLREILAAECGAEKIPRVLVDLQKKHTIFPSELDSLDRWLDSVVFEKVEGIIVTGECTGKAADMDQLKQVREFIDALAARNPERDGYSYDIPVFVGSGVCLNSIAQTKELADGAIVGSSLKHGGFWENEVDRLRVVKFMETWRG